MDIEYVHEPTKAMIKYMSKTIDLQSKKIQELELENKQFQNLKENLIKQFPDCYDGHSHNLVIKRIEKVFKEMKDS